MMTPGEPPGVPAGLVLVPRDIGDRPAQWDGGGGRVRALIAAADLVRCTGLSALLRRDDKIDVVGEAIDGPGALRLATRTLPDVVVIDRGSGWTRSGAMPAITGLPAHAAVLILGPGGDRDAVAQALRAGATGYLVHGQFCVDELLWAVRQTAVRRPCLSPDALGAVVEIVRTAPERTTAPPAPDRRPGPPASCGLSRRQREVMEYIVRGVGNREIAHQLFITEKTVKNHVNHIYARLHAASRAEAIARWLGLAAA